MTASRPPARCWRPRAPGAAAGRRSPGPRPRPGSGAAGTRTPHHVHSAFERIGAIGRGVERRDHLDLGRERAAGGRRGRSPRCGRWSDASSIRPARRSARSFTRARSTGALTLTAPVFSMMSVCRAGRHGRASRGQRGGREARADARESGPARARCPSWTPSFVRGSIIGAGGPGRERAFRSRSDPSVLCLGRPKEM